MIIPITPTESLVIDLWDSMTSLEQLVFAETLAPSSTGHAINYHSNNGMNITSAGRERAFDIIRDSLLDFQSETIRPIESGNMLLDLINRNQSVLATKLLKRMTSSSATETASWTKFIARSLDFGVDEQRTNSRLDEYVLHAAARHGTCDALVGFLDDRRVAVRNRRGDTPLHLAAENGNCRDVEILLDYATPMRLNDDGWTPLHAAAASSRPDAVVAQLLVKRMKQTDPLLLNARTRQFRNTALHLAARNAASSAGFVECLEDLDPTLRNDRLMSPLKVAAERRDDSSIVRAMLEMFLPLTLAAADIVLDEPDDEVATPRRSSPEAISSSSSKASSKVCIVDIGGFECDESDIRTNRKSTLGCSGCRTDSESSEESRRESIVTDAVSRSVDSGCDHLRSVLRLCALNGHVDSVALLVRGGVDAGDVLHDIVEESVRREHRADELVAVYTTIVDNIVDVEDDLRRRRCESVDDNDYGRELRAAVLRLVGATRHGKNVLERAIEIGAEDLLMAIVETPGVFRFDDEGELKKDFWAVRCEIYSYDVTNMIRSTIVAENERLVFDTAGDRNRKRLGNGTASRIKLKPDKCYLETIVEHEDVWRHTDILKRHPFKKLSKSYIGLLRRMYLLVGVLHLSFMVVLSSRYLPSRCSMNERFRLQLDGCSSTTGNVSATRVDEALQASPHCGWLVWPVLLAIYHLYTSVSHLFGAARSLFGLLLSHERFADFRNIGGEAERFVPRALSRLVDKSPFLVFIGAFFFWFAEFDRFRSHVAYLETLSVVFLSGWLLIFMIFNRVTRELYVFSLVLRAVIVEHIVKHFMPIFAFTVVGFSFAFHALGQIRLHRHDDRNAGAACGTMSLGSAVYETLVGVFGYGYLYEATVGSGLDDDDIAAMGGHPSYPKAMFALYVVFTSLILLNYLIAMLNDRYERERARAENAWRFDSLADFVRFERDWSTSWTFGWVHSLDYWFVCLVWPRRQIVDRRRSGNGGGAQDGDDDERVVHVVQVQKYRPWPDDDD